MGGWVGGWRERRTGVDVRGRSEEVGHCFHPPLLHVSHHGFFLRHEGGAYIENHSAFLHPFGFDQARDADGAIGG